MKKAEETDKEPTPSELFGQKLVELIGAVDDDNNALINSLCEEFTDMREAAKRAIEDLEMEMREREK